MTYTCKQCGSSDLVFSATVRWLPEEQRWSTVMVWDARASCGKCQDDVVAKQVME